MQRRACGIRRSPLARNNFGKILAWTIEYDPRVQGDLRGIDKEVQKEILDYMETRYHPLMIPEDSVRPYATARRASGDTECRIIGSCARFRNTG